MAGDVIKNVCSFVLFFSLLLSIFKVNIWLLSCSVLPPCDHARRNSVDLLPVSVCFKEVAASVGESMAHVFAIYADDID